MRKKEKNICLKKKENANFLNSGLTDYGFPFKKREFLEKFFKKLSKKLRFWKSSRIVPFLQFFARKKNDFIIHPTILTASQIQNLTTPSSAKKKIKTNKNEIASAPIF